MIRSSCLQHLVVPALIVALLRFFHIIRNEAPGDTIDAQVQCAPALPTGRPLEVSGDRVALISIPIHLSGKEGHDDDFEIEKQ
jgi:hypothetical protein